MKIDSYQNTKILYINNAQSKNKSITFTSQQEQFNESPELQLFKKASNYAKSIIKKKGYIDLEKADLKKLEGLQNGIEIFEGMNMEQIRLLYKHLAVITMYRGCSNGCVHCFVDAKPVKINPEVLQSMSWEDLNSITNGFQTLNQRLGYKNNQQISGLFKTLAPFMDADSMEIALKDKNGIEHDAVDIAESIKKMGKQTLFDTSGWSPKSAKMQKRAEKYVEYMLREDNNFGQVNISLNPFHKLHAKYIEQLELNPELAKKFRDFYVSRMANVFYTFTPLFDKENFKILNRAVKDGSACDKHYQEKCHRELINDIRTELLRKYMKKSLSFEEIQKNIKFFDQKTEIIDSGKIISQGRMKNIFSPFAEEVADFLDIHEINVKNPTKVLKTERPGFWIDCNGRFYIFDGYDIIKTEMGLNLKTKDRITPQLATITEHELSINEILKGLKNKKPIIKKIFSKLIEFLRK